MERWTKTKAQSQQNRRQMTAMKTRVRTIAEVCTAKRKKWVLQNLIIPLKACYQLTGYPHLHILDASASNQLFCRTERALSRLQANRQEPSPVYYMRRVDEGAGGPGVGEGKTYSRR